MTANKYYYTDLDLAFEPHPITNDIMRKFDVRAIMESMRNIILSDSHSKPFAPDYGAALKRYLFELAEPGIAIGLKRDIKEQLRVFEPRAMVEDVLIGLDEEENTAEIEIQFYVSGITEKQTFNLRLERLR
jgi:phage baseplate assembly protein W